MSELKRCPFCSGEAKIEWEDWKDISPTSGIYRLSVNHKPECFFVQMNGLNAKSEMISSNKERLAEAWNTRKPMQNIVERLEEENTLLKEQRTEAIEYDDEQIIFAANNQIRAFDYSLRVIKEEGGINDNTR